jgi:hypothetical protein
MVLVLVFWGNLAGTGSNETVGGGGGRGGGVDKCIRDAVGADLFAIAGDECSTGICELDFTVDAEFDTSVNIWTAESDISR